MENEPVVTIASITAGAAALVALLVAFGLPVSEDQEKAMLGVVAVLAPIVASYFQRKRVTPVHR